MSDRPKTWQEITDEEVIEAVRLDCAMSKRMGGPGVASGSGVAYILSAPRAEQWPTQPAPANAALGLGLIPRFGEGSAHPASATARLKRMEKLGLLEAVQLVRPMGKPASPGYRVARER